MIEANMERKEFGVNRNKKRMDEKEKETGGREEYMKDLRDKRK